MNIETILSQRSTFLRINHLKPLKISIVQDYLNNLFLINGTSFITQKVTQSNLFIKPQDYYMIINRGNDPIDIHYNQDISNHEIIYNPYKYENSEKIKFTPGLVLEKFQIPNNYMDTLPKWYSFKFTYSQYNLIFVRPECGLSIQIHSHRDEFWEIIEGKPIIISGNNVHYFVENGTKFQNQRNTYHSVINVNKEASKFVLIKEIWKGKFDENDIKRIFNPNHYH